MLTQFAQILKDNPEISKLSVEGNTDDEGDKNGYDNVKLSQQRAGSVLDWLVKDGADAKRLVAVGSRHNLVSNDTPEHMAQNRRVDFHVRLFNGETVAKDEPVAASTPAGHNASASAHQPERAFEGCAGGRKEAFQEGDRKRKVTRRTAPTTQHSRRATRRMLRVLSRFLPRNRRARHGRSHGNCVKYFMRGREHDRCSAGTRA